MLTNPRNYAWPIQRWRQCYDTYEGGQTIRSRTGSNGQRTVVRRPLRRVRRCSEQVTQPITLRAADRHSIEVPQEIVQSRAYREAREAVCRVFIEDDPARPFRYEVQICLNQGPNYILTAADLVSHPHIYILNYVGPLMSVLRPSSLASATPWIQRQSDGTPVRWVAITQSGTPDGLVPEPSA